MHIIIIISSSLAEWARGIFVGPQGGKNSTLRPPCGAEQDRTKKPKTNGGKEWPAKQAKRQPPRHISRKEIDESPSCKGATGKQKKKKKSN